MTGRTRRSEKLGESDPSVDWRTRLDTPVRRLLVRLERWTLAWERPVGRLVRLQYLNPLYHTGPIAIFLLVLVLVTGVYLTMFFRFGFDPSYQAVAALEANPVGRVMRALHRYASGALIVTSLLHGWRTFFQDRFRDARRLAWVTGVVSVGFFWIIGVTGYWLIWDERVVPLNDMLARLLAGWGDGFLIGQVLTDRAGTGWVFVLVLFLIHVILSLTIGLFMWWHTKRLSRTKWLPPNYWMWLLGGLLVAASIVVPAGMPAAPDPVRLPGQIPIDVFYLFFLLGTAPWPWLVAGGLVTLVAAVVPWLLRRPALPPIVISRDRCTGCTFCVADCPYSALRMVPRDDGPHQQLAVVEPDLCVSCGICIGSCPDMAMSLGDRPPEPLWDTTVALVEAAERPTVVFACERHLLHGAEKVNDALVIPVPCIGMVHPDLPVRAVEAGAAEARIVGCPPEDCANREGNLWLEQRIERKRRPRLKRRFAGLPIGTRWLPPDDTPRALDGPLLHDRATGYGVRVTWREIVPAAALMAVVFAIQLLLTNVPATPIAADARIVVTAQHRAGAEIVGVPASATGAVGVVGPWELRILVDGETATTRRSNGPLYERLDIAPGSHHLQIVLEDRPGEPIILVDGTVDADERQVVAFDFVDAAGGPDPKQGRRIFESTNVGAGAGCRVCHSLQPGERRVGPSLAGIGAAAANRVPGLSAEAYLRQSIVDPDAYVVEGFPAGQMFPDYAERLTDEEIDDLVAFLLTLR